MAETFKNGEWSLGLSDEEEGQNILTDNANNVADIDKDADQIISPESNQSQELDELLKDIEKTVQFGPAVIDSVSTGFSKTASRPLSKESKIALKDRILVPENLKEFVVPKVNTEIWKMLPSHAKLQDIKYQQSQEVMSLGLSSLAIIANTMATNKQRIPADIMSSVIKQAIDGANLLGDQLQAMSGRRRFEVKKYLNPEYSGICTNAVANSEWLFGSDLAESLKTSKATATLMRNTVAGNSRYVPYPKQRPPIQQSVPGTLNWRRPLYQQSRGSGYQPRFQHRRPQGPTRMTTPPQSYQNFRKY